MSKSEAGPRISKTSVSSELFVQQMVPDSHRRVEPEQVVASNQSPGGYNAFLTNKTNPFRKRHVDSAAARQRTLAALTAPSLRSNESRTVVPPTWGPVRQPTEKLDIQRQTKTRGRSSVHFTGRQAVIDKLLQVVFPPRRAGSMPRREFLLHGIGGSGKTELALKIVELFEDDERFDPILWVDGGDIGTIEESFRDLAAFYQPQAQGDPVRIILRWLGSLKDQEWLLVFDDCYAGDFSRFLPPGNRGNILFTSRHREIVPPLTPQCRELIDELEPEDATTMLLRVAGLEDDDSVPNRRELARAITKELGNLALAIDQAGAYITEGCCSIDAFLDRFRLQREEILREPMYRGSSAGNLAVYTTFDLSYHKLKTASFATNKTKKSACRSALLIFNMFCFYHNEGLMGEIVKRAAENPKNRRELVTEYLVQKSDLADRGVPQELLTLDTSGKWDSRLFEEGIAVLESFSLLKRTARTDTYSVHVLVYNWARDRMQPDRKRFALVAARTLLFDSIPSKGDAEEYIFKTKCIPHIRACLNFCDGIESVDVFPDQRLHTGVELKKYARILSTVGMELETAEKLWRKIIEIQVAYCTRESPQVLGSMRELALVIREQGPHRYPAAEAVYIDILEIEDKLYGRAGTIRTRINLTRLYEKSERLEEADDLVESMVKIGKSELDESDERLVEIFWLAAEMYLRQKRVDLAAEYAEQAVSLATKLDPEGVSYRTAMRKLAEVREMQGNGEAANRICEDIWKIEQRIHGDTYRETILSRFTQGVTYARNGREEEGWKICKEAYETSKQALGVGHKVTIQLMIGIGSRMIQRGMLDDAVSWLERAADLCEGQPELKGQANDLLNDALTRKRLGSSGTA